MLSKSTVLVLVILNIFYANCTEDAEYVPSVNNDGPVYTEKVGEYPVPVEDESERNNTIFNNILQQILQGYRVPSVQEQQNNGVNSQSQSVVSSVSGQKASSSNVQSTSSQVVNSVASSNSVQSSVAREESSSNSTAQNVDLNRINSIQDVVSTSANNRQYSSNNDVYNSISDVFNAIHQNQAVNDTVQNNNQVVTEYVQVPVDVEHVINDPVFISFLQQFLQMYYTNWVQVHHVQDSSKNLVNAISELVSSMSSTETQNTYKSIIQSIIERYISTHKNEQNVQGQLDVQNVINHPSFATFLQQYLQKYYATLVETNIKNTTSETTNVINYIYQLISSLFTSEKEVNVQKIVNIINQIVRSEQGSSTIQSIISNSKFMQYVRQILQIIYSNLGQSQDVTTYSKLQNIILQIFSLFGSEQGSSINQSTINNIIKSLMGILSNTTGNGHGSEGEYNNCNDNNYQSQNAKYQFATVLDDNIVGNYQQRIEQREGAKVTGSYSYDDGYIMKTVFYVADDNGYRVMKEEVVPSKKTKQQLNGRASVKTILDGSVVDYTITKEDTVPYRKVPNSRPNAVVV